MVIERHAKEFIMVERNDVTLQYSFIQVLTPGPLGWSKKRNI